MTSVATKPATRESWQDVQAQREAANYAIQMSHSGALGDLDDREFDAGIARVKKTLERMHRVLAEVLIPDVHYGIPKTRDGRNVFDKPMLYQAGADDLRKIGRWTLIDMRDPMITFDGEHLECVSFVGIRDTYGHILATASGACCTREPRFKKTNGEGWTFKDAREQLHNCLAQARKRGATMATLDAGCGRSFFANAEGADDVADALQADALFSAWDATDAERVAKTAEAKGMSRAQLIDLMANLDVQLTSVPPMEQVGIVQRAIADWKKPAAPAKPSGGGSASTDVKCPKCGGPMWDNRGNKTNPNAADFRCKDKECKDANGRVTGQWEKNLRKAEPQATPAGAAAAPASAPRPATRGEGPGKPAGLDEIPAALREEERDDLPF